MNFANLRDVPFQGRPPKGDYMPLPNSGPPITAPGSAGFIQWLKRDMPKVYQRVKERAPYLITQGLSGLADTATAGTTTFWGSSDVQTLPTVVMPDDVVTAPAASSAGGWADTIAKLAGPLITGVQQISLFNTQLSLAKAGKPPLNTSQIRLPTIPLGISLSAGGAAPWLIGGGLLVGALFLFGGGRRGRR